MSEEPTESFDDPGLRAAVCRAWGADRAPQALRNRLAASTIDNPSVDPAPLQIPPRAARPVWRWAAAAMVLIAAGLFLRLHHSISPTGQPVAVATTVLPASLADALVARHDECCAAPDHHMPGLARDDFPLLRQQLSGKLGFPVLSERLPDGWAFKGAAVCPVGTTSSAHLLFHRGAAFVSLFSLPADFVTTALRAGECAQISGGHPLAGFTTPTGFYCVVGSSTDGSLSLKSIQEVRDQLRPDVGQTALGTSGRLAIASR